MTLASPRWDLKAAAPAAIGNSSLRICNARTDPVLASEDESRALAALRFSLASDIVELVVLTGDEAFLQTLREGVGAARRLWHVLSSDKISDLLVAGGVGILVLDVQALNEAAARFITDIKHQFPDLVVVVAGNRESETDLARLISDGSIYRFIHKPLSPARARLFADAAVKRFDDRRRRTVEVAAPTAAAPRQPSPILIGGVGAGVAILLVTGWLLHRRSGEQADISAGTAPTQPAAVASPSASVQPLPAVKSVLMEAQERLLARARAALDQQRLDDAASTIEAARKTGIATERVAQLATELAQAREAAKAAPRAASSPPTAAPATLAANAPAPSAPAPGTPAGGAPAVSAPAISTPAVSVPAASAPAGSTPAAKTPATVPDPTEAAALDLLKSARQSLAQDRLVEPENDNAQYYLLALRKLDAQYVGLPPLTDDLGARLVSKGLASLNAQQYDAARDWLDHAAAIGYSSPQADTARHDLDAALARRGFMTHVIAANQLTLVKSVPPRYPPNAERSGVEGWVELDFTVTDTGAVQDVAVGAAKPTGVFEAAASAALLQWRFKPLVRDAKTVATRARIRIRFTLKSD
jgi:TonB family protein